MADERSIKYSEPKGYFPKSVLKKYGGSAKKKTTGEKSSKKK